MRPYFSVGFDLSSRVDLSAPDVADAHRFGRKSSVTRSAGPGGDIRSGQHTGQKRRARVLANKRARRVLLQDLSDRCND